MKFDVHSIRLNAIAIAEIPQVGVQKTGDDACYRAARMSEKVLENYHIVPCSVFRSLVRGKCGNKCYAQSFSKRVKTVSSCNDYYKKATRCGL
jgi:hypothetical protein